MLLRSSAAALITVWFLVPPNTASTWPSFKPQITKILLTREVWRFTVQGWSLVTENDHAGIYVTGVLHNHIPDPLVCLWSWISKDQVQSAAVKLGHKQMNTSQLLWRSGWWWPAIPHLCLKKLHTCLYILMNRFKMISLKSDLMYC